jgi:hypothetical protein
VAEAFFHRVEPIANSSLGNLGDEHLRSNYYILKAAKRLDIKVLQGLYNDAIPSLAAPDSATNCVFAGAPISLCGSRYADAILDGACGTATPWDPETFCAGGPYIEPLNSPRGPAGKFIEDRTIIAIQLGNEALGTEVKVNDQTVTVTAQMISTAAQTLRKALDKRGFTKLPIVVSLVLGQEQTFCSEGAPPAGVDYIAAHPYCDFVSAVPPSWPNDGSQCWTQVQIAVQYHLSEVLRSGAYFHRRNRLQHRVPEQYECAADDDQRGAGVYSGPPDSYLQRRFSVRLSGLLVRVFLRMPIDWMPRRMQRLRPAECGQRLLRHLLHRGLHDRGSGGREICAAVAGVREPARKAARLDSANQRRVNLARNIDVRSDEIQRVWS